MEAGGISPDRVSGQRVDKQVYPYLAGLNPAQHQAVTSDPATPLQILAGPGSGKTRVLTSRVAYLVQHHGLFPHQITAVTFTNKAANEMRKRLNVLLGEKVAGGLVLGTFHAVCVRFLRRYAAAVGLTNNFAIADADDCKKIMSALLKAKAEVLEGARMSLKDRAVLSEISKSKAKGETPEMMAVRASKTAGSSTATDTLGVIAELYEEYELALREANSLDFDDLLVYGLRLFRENPNILESCHHILVDEFQDTNTTQYELMKCFAKAHGGVSVVGDPDQSIYSWRAAEVENLNKMNDDFAGTKAIYLEQNYRSTGSILSAAHSVVAQDKERIQKNLYTAHPKSSAVTLKPFSTPTIEASFISTEIKRLIAYSGNVLNYGDFAILLRYNALSRAIESALQKDSVPNRIVGGHKFFERMEIKDLLAYLQLAENPNFTPAFNRVINVPRRAIGDKTVADLHAAAKKSKCSPMELCERMVDGEQLPDGIKVGTKNKIAGFVGVVRKLRRAGQQNTSVGDLIRMTLEKTGYEDYLRSSQQDFDSRWENVQELISFSVTVSEEQQRQATADVDNPNFAPASLAPLAGMSASMKRQDSNEGTSKPLHPMFRRTSTSSSGAHSRANSVALDVKPALQTRSTRAKGGAGGKGATMRNGKGKAAAKKEEISIVKKEPGLFEDDAIEVSSEEDEGVQPLRGNERPAIKRDQSDLTPIDEVLDPVHKQGVDDPASLTPLSFFLQASMLSTDTEGDKKDDKADSLKVTITTVHAAKGLEWPVVFIPAVEQGTYPSYRCTEPAEIAEERRLLYVAMTRAQLFLTMSHTQFRMMGGEENDKRLSEFVALSQKSDSLVFSDTLPDVNADDRINIASMLGRQAPEESGVKDIIMKHVRSAPPLSMWDAPEPRDQQFNRFARREVTKAARAAEYWASESDDYALPGQGSAPRSAFQTARNYANVDRGERDRMSQPVNVKRETKPPPVILPSRNHHFPELPKFTLGGQEAVKKEQDLGGWTSASSSSLAMMKNLGLPGEGLAGVGLGTGASGSGGSSPMMGGSPRPGSNSTSPRGLAAGRLSGIAMPSRIGRPGLASPGLTAGGGGLGLLGANSAGTGTSSTAAFQARAVSSLDSLKGTGLPEAGPTVQQLPKASGGIGVDGNVASGQPEGALARGKKRLGMGRPAPWGAKRAKGE